LHPQGTDLDMWQNHSEHPLRNLMFMYKRVILMHHVLIIWCRR
jgi:hypothetical protein